MLNASQGEVNTFNIHRAIEKFQRFPGDTGSSEVQIAVLTERVHYMEKHLKANKQDKHSRRGLEAMLSKRKRLMQYLRKKDFATYKELLYQLDLKDVIRERFDYAAAKQPAKRKGGRYAPPPKPKWGLKKQMQNATRKAAAAASAERR
jgi:small subunit ribosomal protein S15